MPPVRLIPAVGAAALAFAPPAVAGGIVVAPAARVAQLAEQGAAGLAVPGHGPTVSREGALASLRTGEIADSLTGGVPGGPALATIGLRPGPVTVYVAVPAPGEHANDRRYPIAVVGAGYRGLLTSESTRLPGLVTLADVAPTVRAIERGGDAPLGWRPAGDTAAELAELDRRLAASADTRVPAQVALAAAVIALCASAAVLRSRYLARATALAAPAILLAGVVAAASGTTRPWLVLTIAIGGGLAAALAAAALAGAFPWLLAGSIAAYLVVLVFSSQTAALATLGPHPERGGRFYGTTNLTATIVLTVGLLAAALLGRRWLVPVALLSLVTVGWSRAGADGGGLVVTAFGFAVLAVLLSRGRLTAPSTAVAVAAAAALGLALVGLDAATGGTSHVTRALEDGPGELAGDIGHRLRLSWLRLEESWSASLKAAVGFAAAVTLLARGPRSPAAIALAAALGLSLFVNDTPTDVAAGGAICLGVLWTVRFVGIERAGAGQ
jgi:hypothetical protein